jgi:hypothetical protein
MARPGLLASLVCASASASAAAAPRSRFFDYVSPQQQRLGAASAAAAAAAAAAAPPLQATVLPQAFADSFGAKCLDGTPPAFYSLVQDPSKWVLFLEGGELRTRLAPLPPNALVD